MKQKIYQVDAFTNELFKGNPAAVCPLNEWPNDEIMQKIAMENNLAETAFYVKKEDRYEIRWFTPKVEVDLCGHATLATAFVLFNPENHIEDMILFYSQRSGELIVTRKGDLITLNFPTDIFDRIELTSENTAGFDSKPIEGYKGKTDYMFVFENEKQIREMKPDLEKISRLEARGVIVTAKGEKVDFVSRFFDPQTNVDEDPVTGSAHTTLTPYWSKVLNKQELTAMQLSERTGYLRCKNLGKRIEISGECKLYMAGEIYF